MFFIVLIPLVILLSTSNINTLEIENITRTWKLNDTEYDGHQLITLNKNNEIAYTNCTTNSHCTLTYEYFGLKEKSFKNKCDIPIYEKTNEIKLNPKVSAVRNGKVVIVQLLKLVEHDDHLEATYLYRFIDTKNCKNHDKQTVNTYFDRKNKNYFIKVWQYATSQIIIYEDGSYDLISNDEKICDGARCKYHIDNNGKIVGKPTAYFMKEYDHEIAIFPTEKKETYFALAATTINLNFRSSEPENKKVTLLLANPEKNDTIIWHREYQEGLFDFDTINNLFALCWSIKWNIHCQQYTSSGLNLINETLVFNHPVKEIGVKNINNNELAIIVGVCSNDNCEGEILYSLYKIQQGYQHSELLGSANLFDMKSMHDEKYVNISKDIKPMIEKEAVCVSVTELRFMQTDISRMLHYMRRCFTTAKYNYNES